MIMLFQVHLIIYLTILTTLKMLKMIFFYLLLQLKKSGVQIPRLYQVCGTEDFLYKYNLKFRDYALSIGIDLTYKESSGGHN